MITKTVTLLVACGAVALLATSASAYTGQNLAPQAKISMTQARSIALKANPGKSPTRS